MGRTTEAREMCGGVIVKVIFQSPGFFLSNSSAPSFKHHMSDYVQ
jgi:hypothetical protein